MPSSMMVSQAATLLNAVVAQQTGQSNLAAITNGADFISVAQTALLTGRDPVLNAMSQVWKRTVFAARPYNQPLASLAMPMDRYGNALRKISPEAKNMEDDEGFKWPAAYDPGQSPPLGNGQSIDMYKIAKQRVLQTNFYGSAAYEQKYTIFERQFDVAFSSAEEFVRFNNACITERRNDRERFEEGKARILQLNFIASILDEGATDRVVHLLSEYNTLTGASPAFTAQTIMQPGNFEAFIRWMYSRIRSLIGLMRESSNKFQTNITGYTILRHTNPENTRVALYRPFLEMIRSMVLSNLYNADMMTLPTYEAIDFWQSIDSPDSISTTPVYTDSTGAVATASAVSSSTVIGLIHDRDALGYALLDDRVNVTPYNAAGDYWNEFYKARFMGIQDMTEKGIVLCLD